MALSPLPPSRGIPNVSKGRRMSMETYMVRIFTGPFSADHEYVSVEAEKVTTANDVVRVACSKIRVSDCQRYELAEVFITGGQLCKERRLSETENPVPVQLLWPKPSANMDYDQGFGGYTGYRFYIRKKNPENSQRTSSWMEYSDPNPVDRFLTAFLQQPTSNKEYSDLCNLPDLNERTLLENIKSRFNNSNIYTYVGSILIAVNPFKFFPIYNPKYVKMYQNKRLGDLPPHIFAIADAAFYTMLRTKRNQCIVISGESGSGKTESTNLLLHHLTALSHKGLHGSGVEQTILGAGPVLEAFGNAKTVHNNNSSRFGKFIQVNYKENGMVHGAIVEKYLLEKSRIVSQATNERNYHVFYYLLQGADSLEREKLHVGKPEDYFYLNQSECYKLEEVDEANEFSRLKQSMEMVGFSQLTQKRIFAVLSAVLHLGNVKFKKKGDQHHDESVTITNPDTIDKISRLLMVKERTLVEALTQKKTIAGDETVVMTHRMEHAVATRDAMAKCLYGALFDWIVLKVNQALLAKRHNSEHQEDEVYRMDYVRHTGNSIGVLDIFGFEDFRWNSFEQFCINYANEHLQYYFNQHIFKFEQEEYKKEGIQWKNIEFIDNTGCLDLFSKKGNGLFSLLDEECNFPGATNDTLLTKFHHHHSRGNVYYEAPQKKEMAFTVVHYAGKVKYQTKEFREKNSDQIRTDIVANLKSSSLSFVRELMGVDPVAVLRWTIVKTLIKSVFAFLKAGKTYKARGGPDAAVVMRRKQSSANDYLNIPDLGTSHFLSSQQRSPTRRNRSPRTSVHDQNNQYLDADSNDDVFMYQRNSGGSLRSPVDPYLSEDEARIMKRATKVMMKNKSFKPKSRPQTMFSDIKTLKAIANRTIYIGNSRNQKPPSVGAQFQWSLSRLMSTLNQANPFFIRCIKSNADKLPCRFDEILVLRQLRYTGMLATVRIRQSGYNYRLTFEEFVQLYKILLPKGLKSGKEDVCTFLQSMNMNSDNYQIGKTKVFLRESEKLHIDECLHCAIMKRVVTLQRWVKTKVERKTYLQLRENTITIQKHIRRFLAQKKMEVIREAALCLQRCYRGYQVRKQYFKERHSAIRIQAHVKGHLTRKRYRAMEADLRRQRELQEASKHTEDMHSSTSDEGVLIKDNSADELEPLNFLQRRDSEESSGILDDSESDTLSEAKSRGDSGSSPPPTPTSQGPDIHVESLQGTKDDYLTQSGKSSRVQSLTKQFQSPERETAGFSDELDGRPTPGTIFVRRGSAARKRPPKMSPAPLAKQESFSDLESPTSLISSPLSPEKLQQIEETLKTRSDRGDNLPFSADDISRSPFRRVIKGAAKHLVPPQEQLRETKSFPNSTLPRISVHFQDDTLKRKMSFSSTLFRRTKSSIKILRDMKTGSGGRKKKDSTADESDDDPDQHSPVSKLMHNMGGVSVLPPHPLSPRSPQHKDDNSAMFPGNDECGLAPPDDNKGKGIAKKRRTRKPDKENRPVEAQKIGWNVEKTSKWQYPEEFVIKETWELLELDKFINEKINQMAKQTGKKESQFDIVFMKCLKSFQTELKATLSVYLQGTKDGSCNIRYRDLFVNFEQIMNDTCVTEKVDPEFPVTLCINAFRGYLDEFRNSASVKNKNTKTKKKQNRPNKREKLKKDTIDHQGHKFSLLQFGIPTFCELCSNIIWIMEKGHVCQVCKYTCHKKCTTKSQTPCKGAQDPLNQRIVGTKVFSVPLGGLVGPEDKVPMFMDHLIVLIETHGLYTEGIYRKSGSAHKIKALKVALDSGTTNIDVDTYPVHVLTSTLKTFFRELPEPLLTFELYDEFIQASEIQDEKEAIQVLYSLIEKLPKVNHDVLERLIFHLARVAHHESSNKMSVNGIAIIFAPCLLRTNKIIQAQDMITQVSRQQLCIEKILFEQLRKLKTTLQDINTLESAELTANERLSVVRASMRPGSKTTTDIQEQERVINSHIESLRKERDDLTSTLPLIEYRHSSDDEMLSADDIDSTYDTGEDGEYQRDDLSLDIPVIGSPQLKLKHLTKDRVSAPARRPPSQYITPSNTPSDGLDLSDGPEAEDDNQSPAATPKKIPDLNTDKGADITPDKSHNSHPVAQDDEATPNKSQTKPINKSAHESENKHRKLTRDYVSPPKRDYDALRLREHFASPKNESPRNRDSDTPRSRDFVASRKLAYLKQSDQTLDTAESDTKDWRRRQVEALIDPQIPSSRSPRGREHVKKQTLHTSVLSQRLEDGDCIEGDSGEPVAMATSDPEGEGHAANSSDTTAVETVASGARDSISDIVDTSDSESKPALHSHNTRDSSNASSAPVTSKGRGHLFGSSPILKTKLTKPAKLQQQSKADSSSQSRKRRLGKEDKQLTLKNAQLNQLTLGGSRSQEELSVSSQSRRSRLLKAQSSSFDSNFTLIGVGSDTDEEIMV